jgi:periplasmic copper chaperone A
MTVITCLLARPAPVASVRAAVGALVAATVIGSATSAAAHVKVFADSTISGHQAQLRFRVPDESDTADTVKLVVTLPQDRPFTDISTKPIPGWTATVTDAPLPKAVNVGGATITKAPRTVTWTAQPGNSIAPGQYQEFDLATDALPAAGQVVLPAAQFYSDATVTHWSEPTVSGKAEPEHPAPAFTIIAANGTSASAAAADSTARVLGGAALLVSLVSAGLVLPPRRPKAEVA